MKLPEIIGIAGTNGSGKDTLADLRLKRQGAQKVTLSDVLRNEARIRGVSTDREHLTAISTEWAQKMGAGTLAIMTLEKYYREAADPRTGLSVVSVRRPAEAAVIHDAGGTIIWVDAPREIRFARTRSRTEGRPEDSASFEEFCREEEMSMTPDVYDPYGLNMSAVRDMSDVQIDSSMNIHTYEAYLVRLFEL